MRDFRLIYSRDSFHARIEFSLGGNNILGRFLGRDKLPPRISPSPRWGVARQRSQGWVIEVRGKAPEPPKRLKSRDMVEKYLDSVGRRFCH
jgi:hypothetical protein